jgi:hypothetical protein
MLTLTFRTGSGDAGVTSRATCFRFCADGTLRAGDNIIAATHVADGWQLAQRQYRDWECAGPTFVFGRRTAVSATVSHGPCHLVRTVGDTLFSGDISLGICLPTWEHDTAKAWHEVVLLPATSTP